MTSNKENDYKYHSHKTTIHDDELMAVYEAAQETSRETFKSKDLHNLCEFNAMQIGRRLSKLEGRGQVKRITSQSPHQWQLRDDD